MSERDRMKPWNELSDEEREAAFAQWYRDRSMSGRDIHKIPWCELTDEEQDVIRASDRERNPELFALLDRITSDGEVTEARPFSEPPPTIEMNETSHSAELGADER